MVDQDGPGVKLNKIKSITIIFYLEILKTHLVVVEEERSDAQQGCQNHSSGHYDGQKVGNVVGDDLILSYSNCDFQKLMSGDHLGG